MARTRKRQSNNFSKLWLFTGLLVILLCAGLYYLKTQSETTNKNIAAKTNNTDLQPAHKPQFDFYSILPQTKIESQQPAAAVSQPTVGIKPEQKTLPPVTQTKSETLPEPPHKKAPTTVTEKGRYMLQVAAVKDFAEVDHFKATLALAGYNVNVQKSIVNNTTWSRISVGPYSSLNAAKAAQTDLAKNGMKSILLKIK